MDFSQVEAEYAELKEQYEAGSITEEQFKSQLQDLMLQDFPAAYVEGDAVEGGDALIINREYIINCQNHIAWFLRFFLHSCLFLSVSLLFLSSPLSFHPWMERGESLDKPVTKPAQAIVAS